MALVVLAVVDVVSLIFAGRAGQSASRWRFLVSMLLHFGHAILESSLCFCTSWSRFGVHSCLRLARELVHSLLSFR